MEFSILLNELLDLYSLNQTELARKINVKPSQVSEWLKGKAKPGYDTLKNISSGLNVSADYLLGLEDDFGVRAAAPMGDGLTSEERELLSLFRALSPYLKEMTLNAVRSWAKNDSDSARKKV